MIFIRMTSHFKFTQLTFTCLKSRIKTLEKGVTTSFRCFLVNLEHISHRFLVFLLLTLNKQMLVGYSKKNTYLILEIKILGYCVKYAQSQQKRH